MNASPKESSPLPLRSTEFHANRNKLLKLYRYDNRNNRNKTSYEKTLFSYAHVPTPSYKPRPCHHALPSLGPSSQPISATTMGQTPPLTCRNRNKLQSCLRYDDRNNSRYRNAHYSRHQPGSATTMGQTQRPSHAGIGTSCKAASDTMTGATETPITAATNPAQLRPWGKRNALSHAGIGKPASDTSGNSRKPVPLTQTTPQAVEEACPTHQACLPSQLLPTIPRRP